MTSPHVPRGRQAVTPYLVVAEIPAVIAFLERAFGAREVHRVDGPDGSIRHAQVLIGDARVMLGRASGGFAPSSGAAYLHVPDADAAYATALQAGAAALSPPADQAWGDRVAGVRDPSGNAWFLAAHREDLPALPEHRSRGARALVLLHERELRAFADVWRRAHAAGVVLPATDDPGYASLEHLLSHVLRAARGYMTWVCEQLELPDPAIRPAPEADDLPAELDAYLEHVCERWRTPLARVADEALEPATYLSRWKVPYSVDAMLEHAVMHPIRHGLQLQELMRGH